MKPATPEEWLLLLGPNFLPAPGESRDQVLCRALERLHTGLAREKAAWSVLLSNAGLGRTVREVKKALNGSHRWDEENDVRPTLAAAAAAPDASDA